MATSNQPSIQMTCSVTDLNGAPLRFAGGEVPDLIFQVPPANMEISAKKLPTREITKGGWVEFHGGDDLDMITVNGGIGIIYRLDYGLVNISEGALDTPAYYFLESLLNTFRNNANSYDARGFIYNTGVVTLTYDRVIYKGLFENLSYSETVDKPYDREYNFTFIVEETSASLIRPIGRRYTVGRSNR